MNLCKNIKYIVLDVDGTLTDGGVNYDDCGHEWKRFDIKDGFIIKNAPKCGLQFVVITGRKSELVERRMNELGVSHIFQGVIQKKIFLENFFNQWHINKDEVAYIGDDLNDLSSMKECRFKACPQDSCAEIKEIADYVAISGGGHGAVREIVEYVLKEKGLWDMFLGSF